jgi:protein SCO1/2
LRRYLDRFDPEIVGLRGPIATTAAIAKSVGIYVDDGQQSAERGYDRNGHSAYVIAIDQTQRAPLFWNSETAPFQFAHDIRVLLNKH